MLRERDSKENGFAGFDSIPEHSWIPLQAIIHQLPNNGIQSESEGDGIGVVWRLDLGRLHLVADVTPTLRDSMLQSCRHSELGDDSDEHRCSQLDDKKVEQTTTRSLHDDS